jgi:NAD(P)-dependent dehydrogenase (short-subunit alcohol dehydrogenase family)
MNSSINGIDGVSNTCIAPSGAPEEIAALAVYLASDESDFVTGVVHAIDGGMSI